MDMPDPNVKHHLFNVPSFVYPYLQQAWSASDYQQMNPTKPDDHLSLSHRIQKIPLHPIMSNTNEDDDQQQGRRTTTTKD